MRGCQWLGHLQIENVNHEAAQFCPKSHTAPSGSDVAGNWMRPLRNDVVDSSSSASPPGSLFIKVRFTDIAWQKEVPSKQAKIDFSSASSTNWRHYRQQWIRGGWKNVLKTTEKIWEDGKCYWQPLCLCVAPCGSVRSLLRRSGERNKMKNSEKLVKISPS